MAVEHLSKKQFHLFYFMIILNHEKEYISCLPSIFIWLCQPKYG